MRREFEYPNDGIKVWTPIGDALAQNPGSETDRGARFLTAVARLAPGATYAQAVADLKVLSARINAEDSSSNAPAGPGGDRRQTIGIAIRGGGAGGLQPG
jgi:hypothetical protein